MFSEADVVSLTFLRETVPVLHSPQQTLFPWLLQGKRYHYYVLHSDSGFLDFCRQRCFFLRFCSHTSTTVIISTADAVLLTSVGTMVSLLPFPQQTFFHPHLHSKWYHYHNFKCKNVLTKSHIFPNEGTYLQNSTFLIMKECLDHYREYGAFGEALKK